MNLQLFSTSNSLLITVYCLKISFEKGTNFSLGSSLWMSVRTHDVQDKQPSESYGASLGEIGTS